MVEGIPSLRSKLVEADVFHERYRAGQSHSFRYKVFYALIDVDEIPRLDEHLWTFSARGRSIYSLGAKDFLDFGRSSIKENIQAWLTDNGYTQPILGLYVFAHLRTLGYNFNPLSVFFVETEQGTHCLAEVDNTFGDGKLYDLGYLNQDGKLKCTLAKNYYVSPFIEHDADFVFDIKKNAGSLRVQVTTVQNGKPVLLAAMVGQLRELSDSRLLGYLFRMPMTPIKVMAAIHWQALRLVMKKVPYLRKQDFPEQQKDFYVHKNHKRHVP